MPAEPITIREEVRDVDHVVYVVAEANATRLECLFAYTPRHIVAAVPNFGKSALIGYGHEWHYVAEKLDLPAPDAQTVDHLLRRYRPAGVGR